MTTPSKQSPEDKLRLILKLIRSGKMDKYLDRITEAAFMRRRQIGIEKRSELMVGDIITISSGCRPRLLAGRRAEVVGFNNTRVQIQLLETVNYRWRAGHTINIPPTLIGSVEQLTRKLITPEQIKNMRPVRVHQREE